MTQWTDRRIPLPSLLARSRARWPGLGASMLDGALAAVAGLGAFALLAIVLWVSAPYPDDGPGGALRVAAAAWLLAHGVVLFRTETLSGVPAPVGITPLLPAVVPVWLLYRATREAMAGEAAEGPETMKGMLGPESTQGTEGSKPVAVGPVWCGVAAGYVGVGLVAALYASAGALRPSWVWTLVCLPLVAVVSAGVGVWRAYERPSGALRVLNRDEQELLSSAGRAALAGAAVLVGGGALLVGLSLVRHGEVVRESFLQVTQGWAGRGAVLLLAVALVPNAAVWAAAYALGPGFLLGAGHGMEPWSAARPPSLMPPFPLLAAVPGSGGEGRLLGWAVGVVPVVAGVVVGRFMARGACAELGRGAVWSVGRTVTGVLGAAVMCGLLLGGLAEVSGGPLGVAVLARFGPVGWQVGAAAAGWVAGVGVPVAVVVRFWSLRRVEERRVEASGSEVREVDEPRAGVPVASAVTHVPAPSEAVGARADGTWEDPDLFPYEVLSADADPFLPDGPNGVDGPDGLDRSNPAPTPPKQS
ncbi:DUF6350 family protein [Streptomyces sp. NPDC001796]|uniref:cell division protein PerM n=1 Tax=Streptomyces sp. NPDC001796 TaxID=3364609 RepID=UPI0036A203D0